MSTATHSASSEFAPERQESGIRPLIENALESLKRLEKEIVRLGLPEAAPPSSRTKNTEGQAVGMRRLTHT